MEIETEETKKEKRISDIDLFKKACLETLQTYWIAKERRSDTKKIEAYFKSYVFNLFELIKPKMKKTELGLQKIEINGKVYELTFSQLADYYELKLLNCIRRNERISFEEAFDLFKVLLLFMEFSKKEE